MCNHKNGSVEGAQGSFGKEKSQIKPDNEWHWDRRDKTLTKKMFILLLLLFHVSFIPPAAPVKEATVIVVSRQTESEISRIRTKKQTK